MKISIHDLEILVNKCSLEFNALSYVNESDPIDITNDFNYIYSSFNKGELNPWYGKKHTEESKLLISKARCKNPCSPKLLEALQNRGHTGPLSESHKNNLKLAKANSNYKFSETHKQNLSLSQIGKKHPVKSVTCPHCNKTGNPGGMSNYHFDKCKSRFTNAT